VTLEITWFLSTNAHGQSFLTVLGHSDLQSTTITCDIGWRRFSVADLVWMGIRSIILSQSDKTWSQSLSALW